MKDKEKFEQYVEGEEFQFKGSENINKIVEKKFAQPKEEIAYQGIRSIENTNQTEPEKKFPTTHINPNSKHRTKKERRRKNMLQGGEHQVT